MANISSNNNNNNSNNNSNENSNKNYANEFHCCYCFDVLYYTLSGLNSNYDWNKLPYSNYKFPVFVTWYKKSIKYDRYDLRGCLGTFSDELPIKIGLKKYAIMSALNDKRFNKVSLKELAYLKCSISLLHSFTKANEWNDWDVGTHGITITFNAKNGIKTYNATYLPEVATQQEWDKYTTLKYLIIKAGWKQGWNGITNLKVTKYQSCKCSMTWHEYLNFMKYIPKITDKNKLKMDKHQYDDILNESDDESVYLSDNNNNDSNNDDDIDDDIDDDDDNNDYDNEYNSDNDDDNDDDDDNSTSNDNDNNSININNNNSNIKVSLLPPTNNNNNILNNNNNISTIISSNNTTFNKVNKIDMNKQFTSSASILSSSSTQQATAMSVSPSPYNNINNKLTNNNITTLYNNNNNDIINDEYMYYNKSRKSQSDSRDIDIDYDNNMDTIMQKALKDRIDKI